MKCTFVLVFIWMLALITPLRAQDLEVRVHVTIPPGAQATTNASLVARLFQYDPLLADGAAEEIDHTVVQALTLLPRRSTELCLPLRGKRKPERRYYISLFVYPSEEVDDSQRLFFIDGFASVLDEHDTEDVQVELKAVRRGSPTEP